MPVKPFQDSLKKFLKSKPQKQALSNPRVLETAEQENLDQLKKGQRSDGSSLPDYSKASVKRYGKTEGPMTLRDTGAFYASIKAEYFKGGITIDGNPIKIDQGIEISLARRHGEKIIGVSKEGEKEVAQEFYREYKNLLSKIT